MEQIAPVRAVASYKNGTTETSVNLEANLSGSSWAAIIAGAFVSAALSLILLALALAWASPRSHLGRMSAYPPRRWVRRPCCG